MNYLIISCFIIFIVIFLTSCEGPVQYDFYIKNTSSSKAKINMKLRGSDTSFTLFGQDSIIIQSKSEIRNTPEDLYTPEFQIFDDIIINNDSTYSKDLVQRKSWNLYWKEPRHGIYTLEIPIP